MKKEYSKVIYFLKFKKLNNIKNNLKEIEKNREKGKKKKKRTKTSTVILTRYTAKNGPHPIYPVPKNEKDFESIDCNI